jgi:ABC exporter DevB family membrane fusion protein
MIGLALTAAAVLTGWLVLREASLRPISTDTTRELPVVVPRSRVVAPGRVEPVSGEVRVAASMPGRLREVLVDVGDEVAKGQILAVLENDEEKSQVTQAEAAVAVARATLDKLLNGARQAERDEATAAVEESTAALRLAALELDRQRGLAKREVGSGQELDRARSEHQVAVARLARARSRAELISSPPRDDDVARLEAELALAEARLAQARAVLEETLVRSPIQGTVLRRLRLPGEQISLLLDTPVILIGDTSRLRVRAEVDEADFPLLRVGQVAVSEADAYGDRQFSGRVSEIGLLMGRMNLRSGDPSERVDTRVLDVLVDLDQGVELPIGLRVRTYFELD